MYFMCSFDALRQFEVMAPRKGIYSVNKWHATVCMNPSKVGTFCAKEGVNTRLDVLAGFAWR